MRRFAMLGCVLLLLGALSQATATVRHERPAPARVQEPVAWHKVTAPQPPQIPAALLGNPDRHRYAHEFYPAQAQQHGNKPAKQAAAR